MLNIAADVLRQYVKALDAAPDYADPAVHESFLPKIREAIRAIESVLANASALGETEVIILRADLDMLRDVENQSTKHLDSLLSRVKQYLSERPAVAGGDATPSSTAAPSKPDDKKGDGMLWAAVAIVALLLLSK
jgi:hypothetical protein